MLNICLLPVNPHRLSPIVFHCLIRNTVISPQTAEQFDSHGGGGGEGGGGVMAGSDANILKSELQPNSVLMHIKRRRLVDGYGRLSAEQPAVLSAPPVVRRAATSCPRSRSKLQSDVIASFA